MTDDDSSDPAALDDHGAESHPEERYLAAAATVSRIIKRETPSALIGGWALAFYSFPRVTADVDLAVYLDPRSLDRLKHWLDFELTADITIHRPDGPSDPLGGVIVIIMPDGVRVEIVNFARLHGVDSGLGRDALASSFELPWGGESLRVVSLPFIIATKVYAASQTVSKAYFDVEALLAKNPGVDVAEVRRICREHRIEGMLDTILAWIDSRRLGAPTE